MKRLIQAMIVLSFFLVLTTSAHAINISVAEIQNGLAVVQGGKAAANSNISWEGANVTKANKNGGFSFSGVVPSDCTGTLTDGVSTLNIALGNCVVSPPSTLGSVLQTGQTTCYGAGVGKELGGEILCAGTDHDGEFRKGVPRSYADNGQTIIDNATALEWEKLDASPLSIHYVDSSSTWLEAFERIAVLNSIAYAGHDDWRLPNINELLSLVDFGRVNSAIDPMFNNGVNSFTQIGAYYWSSTTFQETSCLCSAWVVFSVDGSMSNNGKDSGHASRAVRGGF